MKQSPQRNTKFDEIRAKTENESIGGHAFCQTRWTVRGKSSAAVLHINLHGAHGAVGVVVGVVTPYLQRHRGKGANPWSLRDDDRFFILLLVYLRGICLEAH